MQITLYGIPNCDTVKKARAWLDERGAAYTFHDFRKQGLPEANLDRWLASAGWEKLVNRNGTTWRKLAPGVRENVTDAASAKHALRENVTLVKRPVVEWGTNAVTVGFDAQDWSRRLG